MKTYIIFLALMFSISFNSFAQYSKFVDPDDGLGAIPTQGMASVYFTLVVFAIVFIFLDKGGKQTFIRVTAYLIGFLAYIALIGKVGMLLQAEFLPTKSGVGVISVVLLLVSIWIPIWLNQKTTISESNKKLIYILVLVGLLLTVMVLSQSSHEYKSEQKIVRSTLSGTYGGNFIYRSLRDSTEVDARIELVFFKKNNGNYGQIKIISNACTGDFEGAVNQLSVNVFEMQPIDHFLSNRDSSACRITVNAVDGNHSAVKIQETNCQYFRGFECSFNSVLYKQK
jgi:hypothetical protein